jgi:hypothetical protein
MSLVVGAIVIAVRCSVTVSIGDDTSGIFMRMLGVSCAERSTSFGCTDEGPGSSNTSSKVSPSRMETPLGAALPTVRSRLRGSL